MWIEYGKFWREFDKEDLNSVGTRVVVDDTEYLIGDINELRGVCDDCTAFKADEVVQRYLPALQ